MIFLEEFTLDTVCRSNFSDLFKSRSLLSHWTPFWQTPVYLQISLSQQISLQISMSHYLKKFTGTFTETSHRGEAEIQWLHLQAEIWVLTDIKGAIMALWACLGVVSTDLWRGSGVWQSDTIWWLAWQVRTEHWMLFILNLERLSTLPPITSLLDKLMKYRVDE